MQVKPLDYHHVFFIFLYDCPDDLYPVKNDLYHYKGQLSFSTIGGMLRQDYRAFPIFKGMGKQEIDLLFAAFEPCQFPGNSIIIEPGQPADYLYILASGKVSVRYHPYDGPPFVFDVIEPGDVFGWSMALGRSVYTAAATAEEDSQAYRLSKERLIQLKQHYPELVSILMERLIKQITQRPQSTQGEFLNILMEGVDRNGDVVRRLKKDGR